MYDQHPLVIEHQPNDLEPAPRIVTAHTQHTPRTVILQPHLLSPLPPQPNDFIHAKTVLES